MATFALEGVESREVTVEVDVRRGLPAFAIVGLPDAAVRESRERVRAALLNSGLDFPQQRLTANLAPAYVRKAGPRFDLALAVAVLAASRQVPTEELGTYAICGELSLSGAVRPVNGALSMALGAKRAGYARLFVPEENGAEAALVEGIEILGVPDLARLVGVLKGDWLPGPPRAKRPGGEVVRGPDIADVRGQADGKRALEIAAAGGHNLLMIGPPGAGKTFLARCLPGILPPPTFHEAIEITQVQSVVGMSDGSLASHRPFRSPHHTISASGLVGGGARPRPGEITLAHHGVLFLDELPEFSRDTLEALRQPLEEGFVTITRGQSTLTFPARAMLVAACNACPCARPPADCTCTTPDFARYDRRVSGPLLDRLDLVCRLGPVPPVELVAEDGRTRQGSAAARARVCTARELQRERLAGTGRTSNAAMDSRLTRRLVPLEPSARRRLLEGHRVLGLTARAHDRVVRVARTIADLEGRERVTAQDLDEALGYRVGPAARLAA